MRTVIFRILLTAILLCVLAGCVVIRNDKISAPNGMYVRYSFFGWPVYQRAKIKTNINLGIPPHRGGMCPCCGGKMMMKGSPARPQISPKGGEGERNPMAPGPKKSPYEFKTLPGSDEKDE